MDPPLVQKEGQGACFLAISGFLQKRMACPPTEALEASSSLNDKDVENISLPKDLLEDAGFDDPLPADPTSTPDPSYPSLGVVCEPSATIQANLVMS